MWKAVEINQIPGFFRKSYACLSCVNLPTKFKMCLIPKIFTWYYFFESSGRYLYHNVFFSCLFVWHSDKALDAGSLNFPVTHAKKKKLSASYCFPSVANEMFFCHFLLNAACKERLMFSLCDVRLSVWLSVAYHPPQHDFWAAWAILSNFCFPKDAFFFLQFPAKISNFFHFCILGISAPKQTWTSIHWNKRKQTLRCGCSKARHNVTKHSSLLKS